MSRKAKTLTLTEEERRQLTQIEARGSDWRERRRARTVLLLGQGRSIEDVVAEQKIHRETANCGVRSFLLTFLNSGAWQEGRVAAGIPDGTSRRPRRTGLGAWSRLVLS